MLLAFDCFLFLFLLFSNHFPVSSFLLSFLLSFLPFCLTFLLTSFFLSLSSFLPSLLPPPPSLPRSPTPSRFFSPSAEGVHPGKRRGGGACVAAGAGDRGGQRALAPPPPAAVLHVAAQTSECVRQPATDCWAIANANTHASSIRTQSTGGEMPGRGIEDRPSDRTDFSPLQKILFLILDITSDGLLFFCSCCGQTGFCA